MLVIGIILGALAGAAFGSVSGAIAGMLIGGVIGGLIQFNARKSPPAAAPSAPDLDSRMAVLEARVQGLEKAMHRLVGEAPAASAASPAAASMPATATVASAAPVVARTSVAETAAAIGPAMAAARASTLVTPVATPRVAASATTPAAAPVTPRSAAGPANPPPPAPPPPNAVWRWITGGNALARVGAVVLFIGVAFLARYAVEHVSVPLELRLAGIAVLGLGLLVVGWRLRHDRRGYALTLQGAGIGVLYLTVFAAFALYHLLPPLLAFGLLVVLVAESAILAVKQDALALAVLGTLGGFAAPVLVSTGSGNHVALFTFYAVLDAGIFAIAWFRPWRALNLLGFACTFVVGTAWGVLRYRPEDFATTEPFLALFFLFYVGIAVAYALRRSLEVRAPIDATLVFGTPLVVAGLQAALVRPYEYGMAISAVVMSVVYIGLAYVVAARRREGLRLLVDAFAALGLVFATLAVPLAVDSRWTSATWALEGAAIAWVGLRQQRVGLRTFGLLLQGAAAFAYLRGVELTWMTASVEPMPLLNSRFVGSLLIAIAGVFTAWRYDAAGAARKPAEQAVAPVMLAWGLAWWIGGGGAEIQRFAERQDALAWFVGWLALTAALLLAVARLPGFGLARTPTVALVPALLIIALLEAARLAGTDGHLLSGLHAIAWIAAFPVAVLALRVVERTGRVPGGVLAAAHAALVWLAFTLVAEECAWLIRIASERETWRLATWLLVPSILSLGLSQWHSPRIWPFDRWRIVQVRFGLGLVVIVLVAVALLANVVSSGNAAPLPYVPLLNPLDVTFATVALTAILWWREVAAMGGRLPVAPGGIAAAGALAGLAWITMSTVRVIHRFADVPFRADAAWHSSVVQAALALVWTVVAIAAMVLGNRRQSRAAWMGGVALLIVVIAKLLLVDFANTGTVAQIVSFMGVGLLLLVVAYLAPLPARPAGEAQ